LKDYSGAPGLVRFNDNLNVFKFPDESAAEASVRFVRTSLQFGWSELVRRIRVHIDEYRTSHQYAAVHIRAGDLVFGDWRQFVPVDKYIPSSLLELCIGHLLALNFTVIVISDDARLVAHFISKFPSLLMPADVVPHYAALTTMQQALTDIFLISGAQQIWGPKASSFSQFAANLSNSKVRNAATVVDESTAREWMRAAFGKAENCDDVAPEIRPVVARDICWYLDVFSDSLPISEYRLLSTQAVGLDPECCPALNRAALALATSGEPIDELLSTSAQLAGEVQVTHRDPMFEALVTQFSTMILRSLKEPIVDESAFDRVLEQLYYLDPYQIHKRQVLSNLSSQRTMIRFLHANLNARSAAASSLPGGIFSAISGWRPQGISTVSAMFPQTQRNAEAVTAYLSVVLAALSRKLVEIPAKNVACHFGRVLLSSTGLGTGVGWAYLREAPSVQLCVTFGDAHVRGGSVTGLPTPGLAKARNIPAAGHCGFSIAFPLSKTAAVGPLQLKFFARPGHLEATRRSV
jgi:hypothetical protein